MASFDRDVDQLVDLGGVLNSRYRVQVLLFLVRNGPSPLAEIRYALDLDRSSLFPQIRYLLENGWIDKIKLGDDQMIYSLVHSKVARLVDAVGELDIRKQ